MQRPNVDAIELAYQIIDMHEEIIKLKEENKRLNKIVEEYDKMITDSIKENYRTMGSILSTALNSIKQQNPNTKRDK